MSHDIAKESNNNMVHNYYDVIDSNDLMVDTIRDDTGDVEILIIEKEVRLVVKKLVLFDHYEKMFGMKLMNKNNILYEITAILFSDELLELILVTNQIHYIDKIDKFGMYYPKSKVEVDSIIKNHQYSYVKLNLSFKPIRISNYLRILSEDELVKLLFIRQCPIIIDNCLILLILIETGSMIKSDVIVPYNLSELDPVSSYVPFFIQLLFKFKLINNSIDLAGYIPTLLMNEYCNYLRMMYFEDNEAIGELQSLLHRRVTIDETDTFNIKEMIRFNNPDKIYESIPQHIDNTDEPLFSMFYSGKTQSEILGSYSYNPGCTNFDSNSLSEHIIELIHSGKINNAIDLLLNSINGLNEINLLLLTCYWQLEYIIKKWNENN